MSIVYATKNAKITVLLLTLSLAVTSFAQAYETVRYEVSVQVEDMAFEIYASPDKSSGHE